MPAILLRTIVVLCGLMTGSVLLSAQDSPSPTLTASYDNQPLASVLQDIDRRLPARLFYRAADLPQVNVSAAFSQTPVLLALNEILEDTDLGALPYRDYAYIIGKRSELGREFSAEYFQALQAASRQAENIQEEETVLSVGSVDQLDPSGQATVTGLITEEESGDPIIGATIFWTDLARGTATEADGTFSSRVPTGRHQLTVQYVGYQPLSYEVEVFGNGTLDLQLYRAATDLQEVIVSTQAVDANVENVQIGVARLDLKQVERQAALLGEADVVRGLLLNPGVSSIGEGATGFNVRGGEIDQNLMMQDEAILFNASHALGFFSTYNTDLVSTVDLYKGNIPAQYGGRLASVLAVDMRDGNFDRFKVKASVGPVTGRITLEGPVLPGTSSFLLGIRSSYSDWILRAINIPEVKRSSAFFFDGNLRYTHRINDKNTIVLSGYGSQDEFIYNEEFGFDYQTVFGQLAYNRIISPSLFSSLSVVASTYQSQQTDFQGLDAAVVETGLDYIKLKEQLRYEKTEDLIVNGGVEAIFYSSLPSSRFPNGEQSGVLPLELDKEHGLESALFANAEYTVSPRLSVVAGLRGVMYQFLGPHNQYVYSNPERPSESEVIDTLSYAKGDVIDSDFSLQPRLSARYRFTAETSIKAGYSRTAQFVNQIFNGDTPTPNSQYQLTTSYLPAFRAHNFSLGVFRNFRRNDWETSAEVYYRSIDQLYDYIDFADLVANDQLATQIRTGRGRAYGLELSLKKRRGEVNGWVSYTYARTERQVEGISRGNWYPSNFDKPHNLSMILNYEPNQRSTLSVNFTYSTGRPTTAPVTNYRVQNGLIVPVFSQRNSVRIPDYHRLDLAYTMGKGYDKTKKLKTSWTFSLYNVYGRKNAFSVYYTQSPNQENVANRLAVLGTVFPALTLTIETI